MPRKKKPEDQRRVNLTLTIHPEIREWADSINGRRRRSIPHVFEELIEAEWQRFQARGQTVQPGVPPQQQPFFTLPSRNISPSSNSSNSSADIPWDYSAHY
jgi:hypothetical protein